MTTFAPEDRAKLTTSEQIDCLFDRLPSQRIKRLEAENAALRAEVEKLREALKDMCAVAEFHDWQGSLTGRDIVLKSARAALSKGGE